MGKRVYWCTVGVAVLTLAAELSVPSVMATVMVPFRVDGLFEQAPLWVGGLTVLRVLYIVLPPLGVIGALLAKRWSLYCSMAFALVAAGFSVSVVPFLARLATPDLVGVTGAVLLPNACLVAFAAWLRWWPFRHPAATLP